MVVWDEEVDDVCWASAAGTREWNVGQEPA